MSPESSTESYPAFAHIGLRENPGKNLNQVTCPDRELNPGHLVSRPEALTIALPAADSLDRPPWNVVQRCWMASAMTPEADLLWGRVSPRTDRGALGEFTEEGIVLIVYGFCRL
ncbi:hypothetical protein ANN_03081 [Periplaneta americana]|uniref:Per a allergen n=1 Tax=Periplaneta americana TaxID=6978 RepID=A0ABQ8TZQ4_PERAM|nr:hypothetical protein ANN_03081 [Periplaneta americana]